MLTYIFIIALGAPAIAVLLNYTVLKSTKAFNFAKRRTQVNDFVLKALSILLLAVFSVASLYRENAIHNQLGLFSKDALMPATTTVMAVISCWLGLLTVSMGILSPFFKKRELHDYMAFIAPASVIFSLIFLEPTFIAISGNPDPYHWENILHVTQLFLIGVISFIEILAIPKRKEERSIINRVGSNAGFFLTYLIPFMPAWAPGVLLGAVGNEPKDFTLEHRLLMYLCVFVVFFFYLTGRKKTYSERLFIMVALSMSAYLSYFSIDRTALSMLPLHLCNTAIVITLITYVFHLEGLFYFSYLVNVLGAVFAIIMPNLYVLVSEPKSVLYWFDHVYAFALPILGVALGIFPRPNFKMVKKAIAVFTAYFVLIAFIDGWFNNAPFNVTGEEIDYFFLYSTFYLDKFPFALPLYKPWDIYIGDQLIRLFPLYQLTVYVVFVVAMFGLWGVYAFLYRVSDDHQELARKKIMLRIEKTQLIKELDGRPLSEPLNPGGKDMIKIENFCKTYSGSSKEAVHNLNLEIHAGEVFGFIGHNGAGKSTTIKSMVGIQSISHGRIEIEGFDIARQPLEAKMNIGYVSDNHAVYEKLTGREYVNYVADLYRVSAEDRQERLNKYAKLFKLEDALDREIKGYSHGMKQKIMVISTLIHNPKVWVLDEPLTGLDPTSSYQIKQCMREHANQGNIVFFSSHIIEVVERICDRIAIISDGHLCKCATMNEIKATNKTLEEIYLQYIDDPNLKSEELIK